MEGRRKEEEGGGRRLKGAGSMEYGGESREEGRGKSEEGGLHDIIFSNSTLHPALASLSLPVKSTPTSPSSRSPNLLLREPYLYVSTYPHPLLTSLLV